MNLKTYRAASVADALQEIKRDLGPDAVILHTRTYRRGGWLGFGGKPLVEITASSSCSVNVLGPGKRQGRRDAGASTPTTPRARAAMLERAYATAASNMEEGAPGRVDAVRAAASEEAPASTEGPGAIAEAAGQALSASDAAPNPGASSASGSRSMGEASEGDLPEAPRTAPLEQVAAPTLEIPGPASPATPGVGDHLQSDLLAIKRMVGHVLQRSSATPQPNMPEALFHQYLRMIEGEVAMEVADQIISGVRDELTRDELGDETVVRSAVLRRLEEHIPVCEAPARAGRMEDGRPLTIALVGPTGVGKTTTVAKLAATYKLRQGKKVGLITSDTYRIAAVDQLRTYASIIGLPLQVALSPREMATACESLADCDAILIDTAGRSQHDTGRLEELQSFLRAARPHETHLVLSSVCSQSTMLRAAERFSVVGPNRIIFTKLDEAVSFGTLVNAARSIDARLSFVTTGQEVPDHIEVGRADRLARLVLEGAVASS